MAAILDLDSTFTRAWLPPVRPLFIDIGLERNRVPSPRFVHLGCTATTSQIQVGEMLLHEGAEAYKQEGRAQVYATPSRQTEGQSKRLMTWAGKTSSPAGVHTRLLATL